MTRRPRRPVAQRGASKQTARARPAPAPPPAAAPAPVSPFHRRYSDADKARALELYRSAGLPAAARSVGADKRTVLRWAKAAGASPAVSTEQAAAQTAAANAERHRIIAESREDQTRALAVTARAMANLETRIAELMLRAVAESRTDRGMSDTTKHQLEALKLLTDARLNRIVGMRTRAVHDLQLLTGEETERGGATASVQVLFTVPPAEPGDQPKIIDLTPEQEAG
jgi:transposase-like protein